jgi:acyl dehydratase
VSVRALDDVRVGDVLEQLEVRLTRADLVRYAGASLDMNPIHWSDRVARSAGLDGVIAHGMLTMALGARLVSDWCGDPGAVLEYGVVFTRPVPVPDDDEGVLVVLGGRVSALDPVAATAVLALTATTGGVKVLGKSTALVRLSSAAGSRELAHAPG